MNENRKDDALERLAEAVVDETPVDWQNELSLSPGLASKLRHLQELNAMAELYRGAATGRPVAEDDLFSTPGGPAAPLPEDARLSLWGHLEVIEKLGEGSYGEVYRALDPRLHREVALKLRRHPDPHNRFLEEARRLARVRHANVITVYGADEHDGRVGIWTDLLRGRTLEERLEAEGPLGAHEAAVIGLDLCRALAAVHAAGIVHGDVKTTNVMREDGGAIVLLDFGSGRDHAGLEAGSQDTGDPEPISGTPLTLSPEVLNGAAPDATTDLYALGVLLYRLVSGRYPVAALSLAELRSSHAAGRRTPLRDVRPDLPAGFVAVVERALSPDPAQRFQSAGEMEGALAACIRPSVEPPAVSADRPSRRQLGRYLIPALAAALALAILLPLLRSQRGTPPPPLAVEASLFRADPSGRTAIVTGDRVRPGDQLFLEVETVEASHVYVLNEDEAGDIFVLFPVRNLDVQNPLPAGVRHRLPGSLDGVEQDWTVTSAGGRETLLVICSREPLPDVENTIAALPQADDRRLVQYAELDMVAMEGLRGIGGMAPRAEPVGEPSGRLTELVRSLQGEPSAAGHIWVREIRLSNP